MSLRILLDDKKLKQGLYQNRNLSPESNGAGWPRDTWFQKRLRFVREQQRRKAAEVEISYECALGTIKIRQSTEEN